MRQRSLILNPLLAIAVIFLLAISVSPVMAGEQNGNVLSISAADNGMTLDIPQGTYLTISLRENLTTGFTWGATLSPGLNLISNTYVEDPQSAMKVGVGGTEIWEIYANDTGDQKFSAILTGPGQTGEVTDTFVVNLHVV